MVCWCLRLCIEPCQKNKPYASSEVNLYMYSHTPSCLNPDFGSKLGLVQVELGMGIGIIKNLGWYSLTYPVFLRFPLLELFSLFHSLQESHFILSCLLLFLPLLQSKLTHQLHTHTHTPHNSSLLDFLQLPPRLVLSQTLSPLHLLLTQLQIRRLLLPFLDIWYRYVTQASSGMRLLSLPPPTQTSPASGGLQMGCWHLCSPERERKKNVRPCMPT